MLSVKQYERRLQKYFGFISPFLLKEYAKAYQKHKEKIIDSIKLIDDDEMSRRQGICEESCEQLKDGNCLALKKKGCSSCGKPWAIRSAKVECPLKKWDK